MKKYILFIILFSILFYNGCEKKILTEHEDVIVEIIDKIETREPIFKDGQKLYPIFREKNNHTEFTDVGYEIIYNKIGFINEFGETVIEPIYINYYFYKNTDDEIEYVLCGDGKDIYVYNIYGELYMTIENERYADINVGSDYFFTRKTSIQVFDEIREYSVYNIKTKKNA